LNFRILFDLNWSSFAKDIKEKRKQKKEKDRNKKGRGVPFGPGIVSAHGPPGHLTKRVSSPL
jgi:hypothetical protein